MAKKTIENGQKSKITLEVTSEGDIAITGLYIDCTAIDCICSALQELKKEAIARRMAVLDREVAYKQSQVDSYNQDIKKLRKRLAELASLDSACGYSPDASVRDYIRAKLERQAND